MTPMIASKTIGPTQNIKIVLIPQATQEQQLKKNNKQIFTAALNLFIYSRLCATRASVRYAITQAGTHDEILSLI